MTYDSLAQYFGIQRCNACDAKLNHQTGAQVGNTIHWADRRVTRAGLRHFLMLVAATRLMVGREKWRRVWAYNVWASSVARKELHITIPTKLSASDRAYVRWKLLSVPNAPAAARAWANKENTHVIC